MSALAMTGPPEPAGQPVRRPLWKTHQTRPEPRSALTNGPLWRSRFSTQNAHFCYSIRMIFNRAKQDRPILTLLSLMVVSLLGLLLVPPIPQDQSYHQFADQRILLGMPNFWNVVSNLSFIAIGAAGLWRFHHHSSTIILFLGIFLTGFGSSYYHWNPNDSTLVWDRLPMTLGFMAILAICDISSLAGRSIERTWRFSGSVPL
jgi:hypothetical protein